MNIIQIGANTGNDDLTNIINKRQPDYFVIVEPMSIHNEKIEACYDWVKNKVIENVAISTDSKDSVVFYYHQNDGPEYQVASLDKSHITKHGYSAEGIVEIKVPCLTVNDIIQKHNLKTVDILYIDAEGLDDSIIYSIDFDKCEINRIYYENLHIKTDVKGFLENKGYKIIDNVDLRGWTNLAQKKAKHFYYNECFEESWFDYEELYARMVKEADNNSHFVEIGSWKGRSASFMAVEIINSNKNIKFDCIDTWIGTLDPMEKEKTAAYQNTKYLENLYDIFIANTREVSHIINPIKKSSLEASVLYEDNSLDFVFIDGCHTYDCVKKDIDAYYPKVKPGGVLAGHDIWGPEVWQAITEKFRHSHFDTTSSCWFHRKK